MRRLLREPLFHFALLALLIFAAYSALGPRERATDGIVVTLAKIDQMTAIFAKTWQRPPSPEELKGLIDDYVKEEIYVREALALGLDQDDTVIRRRLRQKMEFMGDADVEALAPTDADLEAYLADNPDTFAVDPLAAFQQIFLNPDQRGDAVVTQAAATLETLRANPASDPAALGDASLLPAGLPPTATTEIGQMFGPEFADAIATAEEDVWTGPIASPYGVHLVRVTAREAGRLPPLAEVREAVLREWTNEKRQELAAARVAALLGRYQVTIETAPVAGTAP